MAEEALEQLAAETREIRLSMWDLVQGGLSENDALKTVLAEHPDRESPHRGISRAGNVALWREKGLWPPPEARERPSNGPGALNLDTMTPIEVWGGADPLPEQSDNIDGIPQEIPEAWMNRVLGLVTTTVNAAILDYHNTLQEQMQDLVRRAAREEVTRAAEETSFPRIGARDGMEPPPRPRTKSGSRANLVRRTKLQGTCDKALFELFEQDRGRRGYNVSQMIDFVLFNFYGKPALSFEKEDNK